METLFTTLTVLTTRSRLKLTRCLQFQTHQTSQNDYFMMCKRLILTTAKHRDVTIKKTLLAWMYVQHKFPCQLRLIYTFLLLQLHTPSTNTEYAWKSFSKVQSLQLCAEIAVGYTFWAYREFLKFCIVFYIRTAKSILVCNAVRAFKQ